MVLLFNHISHFDFSNRPLKRSGRAKASCARVGRDSARRDERQARPKRCRFVISVKHQQHRRSIVEHDESLDWQSQSSLAAAFCISDDAVLWPPFLSPFSHRMILHCMRNRLRRSGQPCFRRSPARLVSGACLYHSSASFMPNKGTRPFESGQKKQTVASKRRAAAMLRTSCLSFSSLGSACRKREVTRACMGMGIVWLMGLQTSEVLAVLAAAYDASNSKPALQWQLPV